MPDNLELPSSLTACYYLETRDLFRSRYFQEALGEAVKSIPIRALDTELAEYVPEHRLQELATIRIRGEALYPVPSILAVNPFLLGYYRMLLGLGKKTVYRMTDGWKAFESMEETGTITEDQKKHLPQVCSAFIERVGELIDCKGIDQINLRIIEEIQLLALGPTLQGRQNTVVGINAGVDVRTVIEGLLSGRIVVDETDEKSITITNTASRKVRIRFGSDPDVTFIEEIGKTSRKILSIEIKGGKDASNLYNRLGEAEKSHLKARGAGFVEFWTIVNASNFDFEKAKAQTPTTRQFFMLSCLMDQETEDFKRFRDLLSSCINI